MTMIDKRGSLAPRRRKAHHWRAIVLHKEGSMASRRCLTTIAVAVAAALAGAPVHAQKAGKDSIAGTVSGPNGSEAGVWVIAETTDLPTKFAKIVVTDDKGRYVIPQLPKATYAVWARGYGLKDSDRTRARRRTPSTIPAYTGTRSSTFPARTSSRVRAIKATASRPT
jgi:hypothetical protein